MFDMLSGQYKNLASKGRYGDTMLAHINPQEAALLKARGGAGTINPQTGLREFYQKGVVTPTYQAPSGYVDPRVPGPAAPAPFDRAFADVVQGGMGVQKITGYTVPNDKKFADKPLVAKYDPSGKFLFYTMEGSNYLVPDPSRPNIISQPRLDAEGKVLDYGVIDLDNQEGSGFGQFLTDVTRDLGPMILTALGANFAAGNLGSLFGSGAGAAGGAAGGTGLTAGAGTGLNLANTVGSGITGLTGTAGTGLNLAATTGGGLGIGAGAAGAGTIGAGLGTTLAGINTGIGAGGGTTGLTTGGVNYGVGTGTSGATTGGTGLTTGGGTGLTTGVDAASGITGGASSGTGLTANTGTGLNLVDATGGGLGINATTGTGLNLVDATGGGLGITAGSTGAGTIGSGIGTTLADINTGIGTGLTTGGGTTGLTTGGGTSLVDTIKNAGTSIIDAVTSNPTILGTVAGTVLTALDDKNKATSTTTTTSIDPEIRAAYLANLQKAKDAAAGLQTRQFQGFTPDYLLASQQTKDIGLGGIGQKTTNKAADLALLEAGFTPQQIAAANAGNASLANATGYTAAQIAAAQANRANVANAVSGAGSQYMNAYQNPYEQQVVQGALGDIERSRLMQEQANMAQATAAKAFGGSRQGIVSGMTNEAALRQAANTAAQLRSAGFTQAAQLGQTDAARALQAQLANQGIDITLEQANAQLRQQGLLSNQAATNQAAQFGAGATNQANLANAAALNQMAQYNAQLQQQAALANQSAFAQGAMIRQGAIGQLGQLGAQQQNLGLSGANAVMEDQIRQQALAQARLDATRNLELERLGITSGALGLQPANVGQTTSQPLYNNTAGNLLSGGLTGAYIGSLLGGRP